ncbi:MAG TPA: ABC transporter ATP-binding protein, partial [Polyangia bacterium]
AHPLELVQLEKAFGTRLAVAGLSLSVKAGEVYGLLGPNGAGKTTTLRMIAGLLTPTAGTVRVAGIDVVKSPEAAKASLGFLTGSTGLYARLTAREVLTFFGRAYGMTKDLIAVRLAAVTASLHIEALLDRRCEGLSTGEKQRVSLARAILHDPPVLVLDEPTNGLDVLASRFLRDLVRSERDRGKAVIFSTHYMAEAELLCDRVGFIYKGELLREDDPASLREATRAQSLEEAFLALVADVESKDAAALAIAGPRVTTGGL